MSVQGGVSSGAKASEGLPELIQGRCEVDSMICPFCSQEIAELWQPVTISTMPTGVDTKHSDHIELSLNRPFGYAVWVKLEWMRCHNFRCGQIIVKVKRKFSRRDYRNERPPKEDDPVDTEETWFAVPRRTTTRPIDKRVPERYANDFREAEIILEDSHRMSCVLSRRILADLLEDYAERSEYTLAQQIDEFLKDTKQPASIMENLHYLREMGDFTAHTKKDTGTAEVIEVSPEEAEWTLHVVERLFDHFIINPLRDKEMRDSIDVKLNRAGRKAIKDRGASEKATGDDKLEA